MLLLSLLFSPSLLSHKRKDRRKPSTRDARRIIFADDSNIFVAANSKDQLSVRDGKPSVTGCKYIYIEINLLHIYVKKCCYVTCISLLLTSTHFSKELDKQDSLDT